MTIMTIDDHKSAGNANSTTAPFTQRVNDSHFNFFSIIVIESNTIDKWDDALNMEKLKF